MTENVSNTNDAGTAETVVARGSSHCYLFFGVKCEVYTTVNSLKYYPSMPWRFRIIHDDGSDIRFVGIPNYCTTRQSAMMRAGRRRCVVARWICRADG